MKTKQLFKTFIGLIILFSIGAHAKIPGELYFKHVESGLCLTPANQVLNARKKSKLVLMACQNSKEQIFRWLSNGGIQQVATGRCVKVASSGKVQPLDELILERQCGDPAHAFKARKNGAIRHVESTLCVRPSRNGIDSPMSGAHLLLDHSCTKARTLFSFINIGNLDVDHDGVVDSLDQCPHTLPAVAVDTNGCDFVDSDNDGLSDQQEKQLGTDPLSADSDSDGLNDGQEVKTYFSNPLLSDTDGSGNSDGQEIRQGTNPLDGTDDILILPSVLRDGAGFNWGIGFDGFAFQILQNGDDKPTLAEANSWVQEYSPIPQSNREMQLISESRVDGLTARRNIFVPSDIGAARYIDSVTNNGDRAVTVQTVHTGYLDSIVNAQVVATGSGDIEFDADDDYLVLDSVPSTGKPKVTFIVQNSKNGEILRPTAVALVGNYVHVTYQFTLLPGETLSLAFLALQRNSIEQSTNDAMTMLQPSHPIWIGLSSPDLANFFN